MFNAPLSLDRAKYLIDIMDLDDGANIVDFGCGDGTFLRLLAEQYNIQGVGIDNNPTLIEQASQTDTSSLTFVAEDATLYSAKIKPVDAIICIGAEYIFGGYAPFLDSMMPLLKPNGKLLVGTIYWKHRPTEDYLQLMNGQNSHFDLHTTVQLAYERQFIPLDVGRSTDDEWDKFESHATRKRYQDISKRDQTWAWQQGYLRWGMDTMGFCFLLLQR